MTRVVWNTQDIVKDMAVRQWSKTGHVFVKDAMRKANAIYGREMSAHHC